MTRIEQTSPDVLVISLSPFPTATRARKAALTYSRAGWGTKFLGMASVGRSESRSFSGAMRVEDVEIIHVSSARTVTTPGRFTNLRNAAVSYAPSLLRMMRHAISTPAQRVHVVSSPLIILGILHKLRYRSQVILDVTERPGVVTASGSLASLFSRIELPILKAASRWVDLATVVVQPDASTLRTIGFTNVEVVRNAPMSDWRADYSDPLNNAPTQFLVIGSIFEGRGYEILIDAAAQASMVTDFTVRIFGSGRTAYVEELKRLAVIKGVAENLEWKGSIRPDEVSAAYIGGHVGMVLYEPIDPGNDGLSNKILECVSSGRPVLAADLPQNNGFVIAHKVGWLSEMNSKDLAAAMVAIAGSPEEDIVALARRCRSLGDAWLYWESEFSPAHLRLDS